MLGFERLLVPWVPRRDLHLVCVLITWSIVAGTRQSSPLLNIAAAWLGIPRSAILADSLHYLDIT